MSSVVVEAVSPVCRCRQPQFAKRRALLGVQPLGRLGKRNEADEIQEEAVARHLSARGRW